MSSSQYKLKRPSTCLGNRIRALQEENEKLKAFEASIIKIQSIEAQDGENGMRLVFEQDPALAHYVAQAFASIVMGSPNYTEMTFEPRLTLRAAHPDCNVLVTVQKVNGKSPHKLRQEAEDKYSKLKIDYDRLASSCTPVANPT